MIYDYRCLKCEFEFEVIKRLADIDRVENCPECGGSTDRFIGRAAHVHSSAGDWNRVEFNAGLGCWTKGNKHASQIAKSRGLIEVGNEKPDTIHKHFDQQRKETREQRWNDDRVKLYGDD